MSSETSIYTLGASNHSGKERSELDYYGTDPRSVEALLKREAFCEEIWEPCAGRHNISDTLKKHSYIVKESDIFGYGKDHEIVDFLEYKGVWKGDIVTNPPYSQAADFVVKSLEVVGEGHKVAMFLRTAFLEGQSRYGRIYKENPPKTVYVFSKRQVCSKIDDFTEGSAVSYAWFVWEKGFRGDPIIRWIPE